MSSASKRYVRKYDSDSDDDLPVVTEPVKTLSTISQSLKIDQTNFDKDFNDDLSKIKSMRLNHNKLAILNSESYDYRNRIEGIRSEYYNYDVLSSSDNELLNAPDFLSRKCNQQLYVDDIKKATTDDILTNAYTDTIRCAVKPQICEEITSDCMNIGYFYLMSVIRSKSNDSLYPIKIFGYKLHVEDEFISIKNGMIIDNPIEVIEFKGKRTASLSKYNVKDMLEMCSSKAFSLPQFLKLSENLIFEVGFDDRYVNLPDSGSGVKVELNGVYLRIKDKKYVYSPYRPKVLNSPVIMTNLISGDDNLTISRRSTNDFDELEEKFANIIIRLLDRISGEQPIGSRDQFMLRFMSRADVDVRYISDFYDVYPTLFRIIHRYYLIESFEDLNSILFGQDS